MSRLERDGKIVITYTKGKPEVVLEGDINGRMIKRLPRYLMAAYRRARLQAQRTGLEPKLKETKETKETKEKKEAKLNERKSNVSSKGNKGGAGVS